MAVPFACLEKDKYRQIGGGVLYIEYFGVVWYYNLAKVDSEGEGYAYKKIKKLSRTIIDFDSKKVLFERADYDMYQNKLADKNRRRR